MNKQTILLLAVGALAIAGGAWALLASKGDGASKPAPEALVSREGKALADASGSKKPKAQAAKRTGTRVQEGAPVREKPKFDIGAVEEERLTAEQRRLIDEIRGALRADDYRLLMKLVRKMQASDEWPDGIPVAVKKAALEALGWYGSKCLPEIIGFLGDQDPAIVADAVSQWEDAIAECDSDREIAEQVKFASKIVRDAESLDSILSEISGMRHSVAVDTMKDVLASGNKVAIEQLKQIVADYTDDASLTTAEALDDWLKKHPDEPDDEEMYGGISDDGGEDDE